MNIMENNTTSKVFDSLPAGAILFRDSDEVSAVWSGLRADYTGYALVYIEGKGIVQVSTGDEATKWVNRGGLAGAETATLVKELAAAWKSRSYLNGVITEKNEQARTLRRDLNEAISEWASQHVDDDSEGWTELSDLLTDFGLEGLKKTYKVTIKVAYEVEVEVEAASEDAARDEVDNDLSAYISDNIDTDYYEDYEIDVEDA